jgi:hypothetical protein
MTKILCQKDIDDFFKKHGSNGFPKEYVANGKCHIGGKKDCRFHQIKDGKENCKRGWCSC